MLVVKKVSKIYGIRTILAGVTFALGPGQKAALVGPNGVGKSTLLKILAGIETPNKGEVSIARHIGVGYLAQEVDALPRETVEEYIRRVSGIIDIENQMKALEPRLEEEAILEEYTEIMELYSRAGGYDFERRIRNVLDGFQLTAIRLDHPVAQLSGGQKTKISLTAILLKGVDMLFLDEPTNNLDLPALIWLEEYLIASPAICVIASHDRRFLDRVVTKILEIDWFKRDASLHTGNYTDYANRKALEIRRLREAYRLQQEELKRLRAAALEKHDWAAKGAIQPWDDNDKMGRNFARDRSKKLSVTGNAITTRMENIERVEKLEERAPLQIKFTAIPEEEHQSITLTDVVVGYKDHFQFGPLTMDIPFGSRIGIVGANGSGKSTLLKTITGDLAPLSGTVTRGEALRIGNFTQEHENLPKYQTIKWLFGEIAGIYDASYIAVLLHRFHISAMDASRDTIGELSPGERARLLLAVYSEMNVNVLVLDEPTNHLDIEAIEALEEILENYAGTVILVTHDRYFLERIPKLDTSLLADGKLTHMGDYEAYAASLAKEAQFMVRRLANVSVKK
jgi:ATPase subunit of ABC transporter with duplicated ATPase domains